VREVDYRADEVVRLTGYVGYHLHLELAPGESFVALGAGDSAAVDIAAEGRHIMLKPKAARVATNLTLVSSRRVYHFEYRVMEAAPSEATAMFSLRFRYPDPASEVAPVATPLPFSSVSAPPVEGSPAPPLRVRTVNRSYWFCGWPALQPVAASDDGVQTRLTFAATAEWPAIFVRNDDGSESLVNFHADGTTAVVHRVARQFVLRRGALVGCVENRAYAGGGAWVANGAHDPHVTREVAP
jgi:type IV secretion system protein VirB9